MARQRLQITATSRRRQFSRGRALFKQVGRLPTTEVDMARRNIAIEPVKLREIITLRGYTQREVAERLSVKWKRFSMYLYGVNKMPPETLEATCKLLDIDESVIIKKDAQFDLKKSIMEELHRITARIHAGEDTIENRRVFIRAWNSAAKYHLVQPSDKLLADAVKDSHNENASALKALITSIESTDADAPDEAE